MKHFSRPNDRIIVALDVPNMAAAMGAAESVADMIGGFKIGFELILACIANLVEPGAEEATARLFLLRRFFEVVRGRLFLDCKLKDITNTVEGAARQIARLNPQSFNVHTDGSFQMLQGVVATVRQANVNSKIWGVTLLTDMTYRDLADLEDLNLDIPPDSPDAKTQILNTVLRRAARAQRAGLDGVIASAQEAQAIRNLCGDDFDIVTPAIRPLWAAAGDQKRITTPADAIKAGADYLVIGRPILKPPPEVDTPQRAIELICEEIHRAAV